MKIKKHDAQLMIKLPSELKVQAEKKLLEKGLSMSEFIRQKLEEVVREQ